MKRAKKTERRINFLEDLTNIMREHEYLGNEENRRGIGENAIQRAVFSRLNKSLPDIIEKHFYLNRKKAQDMVQKGFAYESKKKVSVHGFPFFATNHRPDAILDINDLRIGFEIKKGKSGLAIRSGIGQSIVYSSQFDFCVYFFVDTTPGSDIKNSISSDKESKLMESLWEFHNIKFFVV